MNDEQKVEKDSLARRIAMNVAQTIYSRKTTWRGKILKSIVLFGVTLFQKRYGFMKDEIVDADIGFSAEELDAYQFPEEDENNLHTDV